MNDVTRRWTQGAFGALISGGSGAVAASTAVVTFDPKDWGMGPHLLELIAWTFLVCGGVSFFKYLRQHPLPGMDVPEGQ